MSLIDKFKKPIEKFDSLLFVCTGNICRSPLAEAIAKNEAQKRGLDIKIDSAGTGSWHIGEPPCEKARLIAKRHDLDIDSYKARQVLRDDDSFFDLIVVMDRRNQMDIKVFKIKDVRKLGFYGLNNQDIPDPYTYENLDDFEEVYQMIEKGVKALFDTHFPS